MIVSDVLDPYGPGGWPSHPHSPYGAVGEAGWARGWTWDQPGRSSDPATPSVPPPRGLDNPYHNSCPVHSPFRYRFLNGGIDHHHLHHTHQVSGSTVSISEMESAVKLFLFLFEYALNFI